MRVRNFKRGIPFRGILNMYNVSTNEASMEKEDRVTMEYHVESSPLEGFVNKESKEEQFWCNCRLDSNATIVETDIILAF